jgi:hypothetical protein
VVRRSRTYCWANTRPQLQPQCSPFEIYRRDFGVAAIWVAQLFSRQMHLEHYLLLISLLS